MDFEQEARRIAGAVAELSLSDKVEALNLIREALHEVSPFRTEPVDFVRWVENCNVYGNSYNPNVVAPPELELLRISISHDGMTQPIVSMADEDGKRQVIDGFHRHRVGKESPDISARLQGYLPVVQIRESQTGHNDRVASTIRHNRARGKHQVQAMSDIVIELKRRNWSDDRIARELGMDADEVLRLCQITGLAEAFANTSFTQAWEVQRDESAGAEILSDVIEDYVPNDGDRILHTYEKWECYRAGFYAERPPGGLSQDEAERQYAQFLGDSDRFRYALEIVTSEWTHSCEHFLTNDRMNRIAWLGQASAAQALGMPATCRGGFRLLTKEQQDIADGVAHEALNNWLEAHGRQKVSVELARGRTEAELY